MRSKLAPLKKGQIKSKQIGTNIYIHLKIAFNQKLRKVADIN